MRSSNTLPRSIDWPEGGDWKVGIGLGDMLAKRHAMLPNFVGGAALAGLKSELDALRWSRRDRGNRGNGSSRAFRSDLRSPTEHLLYSGRPVPRLLGFGFALESAIQEEAQARLESGEGDSRGLDLLTRWEFDHALVNIMRRRKGEAPRLRTHIDPPRFKGLLAILSFAPATLHIDGEAHDTEAGTLELFMAADLAEARGTTQAPHAVVARADMRYSAVFTSDDAPRQTVARLARMNVINPLVDRLRRAA